MAMARPTRSCERPRPPVHLREGKWWLVFDEWGAGRRRKMRALKALTWRARRWCAVSVRRTLRVMIERKDAFFAAVFEGGDVGICRSASATERGKTVAPELEA